MGAGEPFVSPARLVILHRTRTSGTCPECGRTTREIRTEHRRDIGVFHACYDCSLRTTIHPVGSTTKIHEWIRSLRA